MDIAKTLVLLGVLMIFAGGALILLEKIPGLGRLPGDIIIKKDNYSLYFPVTTCIVLSFAISLILYFIKRHVS